MKNENFKRGDSVRLKSGGPAMTIEELILDSSNIEDHKALCTWIRTDGIREQYQFFLSMLEFD